MQVQERDLKEIQQKAGRMSDFLRMEYLESVVAKFHDVNIHRYCYLELSRLYEMRKMYSDAIKYIFKYQETLVIQSEKNNALVKEMELLISAGQYERADLIVKKLMETIKEKEKYELIRKEEFRFLWVVDFPLLEYSEEEKRYMARHHPFTSPQGNIRDFEGDYESIKAKAYDIVLNGVEIGGGSIRIFRMDDQMEMFRLLNIKEEEAVEKFGFLLEALEMGAPPHGGIAFGFDRILMMLMRLDSIREVIPFPKTQRGTCLLSGAPSRIAQKQLNELKIRTTAEPA